VRILLAGPMPGKIQGLMVIEGIRHIALPIKGLVSMYG
jgi:hypothetical protein